jgi:hypothetical protein
MDYRRFMAPSYLPWAETFTSTFSIPVGLNTVPMVFELICGLNGTAPSFAG